VGDLLREENRNDGDGETMIFSGHCRKDNENTDVE